MFKIAVFVSGRGSNLKAIYNRIESGELEARIAAVISYKKCSAVEFAIDKNIPVFLIDYTKGYFYENETEQLKTYKDLVSYLQLKNIDLIVLAGYLKKIPGEFIKHFENGIINIHPALLPKYGGKGMYGMNIHKAVFNAGEKESGATVHFVNEIYDNGKIIEQRKIDITHTNSPEEIAEKVLHIEHELLPDVINKFAKEKINNFEKISIT